MYQYLGGINKNVEENMCRFGDYDVLVMLYICDIHTVYKRISPDFPVVKSKAEEQRIVS